MKIPEKYQTLDFFVERLGTPLLVATFFGYLIFVRFSQVDKRQYKQLRYTKAIMEKMHVPIPEEEK